MRQKGFQRLPQGKLEVTVYNIQKGQIFILTDPCPAPFCLTSRCRRTAYMRHGSCSELQLPRRIPAVAELWR